MDYKNALKIAMCQKDFNPLEIDFLKKNKLTYDEILMTSVFFTFSSNMETKPLKIIKKRHKLNVLISPIGIFSKKNDFEILIELLIKSVQYN